MKSKVSTTPNLYYKKIVSQLIKTHELDVEKFLDDNYRDNQKKFYFIDGLGRQLLHQGFPETNLDSPIQVLRTYHWIRKMVRERAKEAHESTMTIFDIWLGNWSELKTIIDSHLSDFMLTNGDSHQLIWKRRHGDFQYMAGFYKVCLDKKWIKPNYDAPHLKMIFENTFQITIKNEKPFKPSSYNFLKDRYTAPFQVIPRRKL